jgi:CubicO group peptidase (beta-lactamase class C family)
MDEKIGISYGYLWYVLPEDSGFGRAFFHTGVGVHMVMVIPDSQLVLVHRVDTEAPYSITSQNLYELLGLLMGAKLRE